jgi:hypothetical protein
MVYDKEALIQQITQNRIPLANIKHFEMDAMLWYICILEVQTQHLLKHICETQ